MIIIIEHLGANTFPRRRRIRRLVILKKIRPRRIAPRFFVQSTIDRDGAGSAVAHILPRHVRPGKRITPRRQRQVDRRIAIVGEHPVSTPKAGRHHPVPCPAPFDPNRGFLRLPAPYAPPSPLDPTCRCIGFLQCLDQEATIFPTRYLDVHTVEQTVTEGIGQFRRSDAENIIVLSSPLRAGGTKATVRPLPWNIAAPRTPAHTAESFRRLRKG